MIIMNEYIFFLMTEFTIFYDINLLIILSFLVYNIQYIGNYTIALTENDCFDHASTFNNKRQFLIIGRKEIMRPL